MVAKANSLVVLLAVLLLAVPFAVCAPMPHAAMASMHCAECCPTNAAPTPSTCCTPQPQANPRPVDAPHILPLAPAHVLYVPSALAQPSHAFATSRFSPPPLLQTPLRI